MTPPVLVADRLGRSLEGRWLWRGLDVTLGAGERLALTGPTGSGKTLVLRALAGLDPLDEGTITFEGTPLARWSMPRYRARVRILAQRPSMVEGTVEENLRLPFRLRVHRNRRFELDAAVAHLERLDRPVTFLEKRAQQLSGGEGQLVALVRTLLVSPRILLLDEPTASLDDAAAQAFEALVASWLDADSERAVIWTSHDASQLARVSDRRVALSAP